MVLSLALLLVATPPSPACSPDEIKPLWSIPDDGSTMFPYDARLAVEIGEGWGDLQPFTWRLLQGEEEVPVSESSRAYLHDSPNDTRYLLSLFPEDDLDPGAAYTLVVEHDLLGSEYGLVADFEVGTDPATTVQATPWVEALAVRDVPTEELTNCDWGTVQAYELEIHPGFTDPRRVALMHLYRADETAGNATYVRPLRNPTDGKPFVVEVWMDARMTQDDCFYMVGENGAGKLTPPSEISCVGDVPQDTGDPGEGPAFTVVGGSGCECDGTGGGGSALLLALVALFRRRRR